MPRHLTDHSRMVYALPSDFPQRLKRFQRESGLSWAEIARRLGVSPYTVWRWHEAGVRPHFRHLMALLELADELGLVHLFTDWTVPRENRCEPPAPGVPRRSPGRKGAGQRGG